MTDCAPLRVGDPSRNFGLTVSSWSMMSLKRAGTSA
jgi:hypothetical protein